MSHIANELRAQGRRFSQTTLSNDLEGFTPVFQEGKVVFYEDSVVNVLMDKYRVRNTTTEVPAEPAQQAQLDKIQKMLEAICKSFDLEVT